MILRFCEGEVAGSDRMLSHRGACGVRGMWGTVADIDIDGGRWGSPGVVPRRLRLEFPGACCHVINRGNCRSDIFRAEGARHGFESRLFEMGHSVALTPPPAHPPV